ncbi:sugar phosphate nucleotidyltransferase [Amylibacter sp.]|nr:sugar phosphate nucleotidyltransferase [Amylibacter sp.]
MEVGGPDIFKYGVIVPGNEPGLVAGLIKKPDTDKAPPNLASIGCYVLTPDIFDILLNQPAGAGGEIQLADAIHTLAENEAVEAVRLNGRRLDCDGVNGYLDAITHVAGR